MQNAVTRYGRIIRCGGGPSTSGLLFHDRDHDFELAFVALGRVVVDVEPVKALKRALPLSELKADSILSEMSFVKMPRVAVQPVTKEQWDRVLELSGTSLR